MFEQIFAQALGPGLHGGGGTTVVGPIRASRRAGNGPNVSVGASRGPGGPSIFVGNGPGDQFLQSLISNLTGMHGPGQFQFMMGGPPGSNVMYGNPGDYAWGRGGFDAIVTQLLNQMEGTGPPRMENEEIVELPKIKVAQEHIGKFIKLYVLYQNI